MAGLAAPWLFGLGIALLALASAGAAYTLLAAWLLRGYRAQALVLTENAALPITVLKPLYGAEPRLLQNLQTLLAQDYPGPVQIIFGVREATDPAVAVVQALQNAHPQADITLVIEPRRHGANNKLSNLINMAAHMRHPLVVLADSDVAVPPDCLRRLAAALAEPGMGLVSCMHFGRGDAGFWSVLGAMDISYRYMPSVAVASATGLDQPCLGPTMALRRDTLDAVGGFGAFADVLADDYELGRAVRALGLRIGIPRFSIVHSGDETTLRALVAHELRWSRTIYGINPAGFAGSVVTHCLPLALLGVLLCAALGTLGSAALAVLAAAFFSRVLLVRVANRVAGFSSGPLWLLPLRDALSLAVFVVTFFVRTVSWRGARFSVARDGRMATRD
ncbi:MAG: bacteriohopanetetrol glucosamine biosynthesis glycosyltransferase HpnI [Burkholderiales bacterium]